MLRVENPTPTTVEYLNADGATGDNPRYFFLERYAEAYRRELSHFVDCVVDGVPPLTGAEAAGTCSGGRGQRVPRFGTPGPRLGDPCLLLRRLLA